VNERFFTPPFVCLFAFKLTTLCFK